MSSTHVKSKQMGKSRVKKNYRHSGMTIFKQYLECVLPNFHSSKNVSLKINSGSSLEKREKKLGKIYIFHFFVSFANGESLKSLIWKCLHFYYLPCCLFCFRPLTTSKCLCLMKNKRIWII